MNLLEKIQDRRNIFNSIFSLESYVFDIGLLNTSETVDLFDDRGNKKETIASSDLELFYALADKHNVELIEKVIDCCRQRLEWLFLDSKNLFEVVVYFKLKNYDEGCLNFRPLHTARLIDLLCMVSILNCLMFDDDLDQGTRRLSDLSKLLPHNFYGNIPSTDVQFLFHKWQIKYKEYTEAVITHCRSYQHDHSYLTEVCLDIKNFYPSISPVMLYDYIIGKISKTYEGDMGDLGKAVAKLLFFKIKKENIEPWKEYYYPEKINLSGDEVYMNHGIPQGLPQSYFFGNLCMLEVKRLLMRDEFFKGDAYFYVDDSVIYMKEKLDDDEFKDKLTRLNESLSEWCNPGKKKKSQIGEFVSKDYLGFQGKLRYVIKFHEDGKSVYTHIDDADNQYGPIAIFPREASMHAKLIYNLDEIDDHVSLKKLEALDKVISREITRLTEKQKADGKSRSGDTLSQLKLLRRFKKFFLYRNRLLRIREGEAQSDIMLQDFKKRFMGENMSAEKFFEQFEEDIFQTEYRLLIQKLDSEKAKKLKSSIITFEKLMLDTYVDDTANKSRSLFFAKDVEATYKLKSMSIDIYASLVRWVRVNYSGLKSMDLDRQMDVFRLFLSRDADALEKHGIQDMLLKGFNGKESTRFVMMSSPEYQRRILNVYFSEIMDIAPSDELSFTKRNARRLRYAELRLIAYLRNRFFDLDRFTAFFGMINCKNISDQMGIDMGVLEVLNVFIRSVRKPEWVDSLIMTHRLTKGLWYNGSKFLNSYTLHNEEHAVTLITKSLELTNRIDYFVLKDIDYYILFLSCYLHDISMVIHPDMGRLSSDNGTNLVLISELMVKMREAVDAFGEVDPKDKKNSRYKNAGTFIVEIFNKVYSYYETLVRDNHAKDSAKFIRSRAESLLDFLGPTLLSFVAKVSESHGYDVMDVYGLKSRAKDDTVSLKYLMIIIRLADLLDVANDRVNYHLLRQNLKNLSQTSKFHWISHLVTDKIELDTDYITDETVEMGNKPITEEINLTLSLNVKQLTVASRRGKCEGCQLEKRKDSLCIKIKSANGVMPRCSEKNCTVLCYWMMRKHDWLIKELIALNDYLFAVNNSLFKTKINFIIHYRDEMRLDADMFDSVQEYLEA